MLRFHIDLVLLQNTAQRPITLFMYQPSIFPTAFQASYTDWWISSLKLQKSFSRLPICKEALLKLLSHYSVLPQFTDVLVTFGEKTDEIKENFSIYQQHISQKSPGTNIDSDFLGK